MPDFTPKQTVNSDQIINAYRNREAAKKNPLTTVIESSMSGAAEGLKLAETVNTVLQKRQRAKALAQLVSDPDFQMQDAASGGQLSMAIKLDPDSAGKTLMEMRKNTLQEKELQQKMDIAGEDQAIKREKSANDLQEQSMKSAFTKVRAEMLAEYKSNPAAFKQKYGNEGLTIIGGKQPDWFSKLMGGGASGINPDPNAK